jgi:hypothetical protein
MIKTTKATVEEAFNATVIYGDTDSVMVNFHCGDRPDALAEALRLGKVSATSPYIYIYILNGCITDVTGLSRRTCQR